MYDTVQLSLLGCMLSSRLLVVDYLKFGFQTPRIGIINDVGQMMLFIPHPVPFKASL